MRRQTKAKKAQLDEAQELFKCACQLDERGKFRAAFPLLLKAAELGDTSAQLNLGYYYDVGSGVRKNRSAAMLWYRRAYRNDGGSSSSANNIGTIYRDEGNFDRAIFWFKRAVEFCGYDANLELAKIYLRKPNGKDRAIRHLKAVLAATPPIGVGEDEQDEARRLLQQLRST